MALRKSLLGASIAFVASASQPGARSPVEAPMRDLQWGNLNFLHTTDTHGWHGGHLQEPQYSADWGDYISFAAHLRARADAEGSDLLLIDTGDRVEGNGLYDASNPQGKYTYDIFREQDIDIICTGNHELYVAETAAREHTKTVPNFPNNYIASNLDYIVPETGEQIPMAQRFNRFKTKNQGIDIVAFGFIFDFTGNANNTVVQPVERTVEEKWFLDAINIETAPDLYVVIGHVGIRMDEYQTILRAIRESNPFVPIAFFGGHHHVRDSATYDPRAFALASGRYFETIGFMSIDGITTGSKYKVEPKDDDEVSFHRRYIDTNIFGFHHHTGLNETTFPTNHGQNVSAMITEARNSLDLDYTHGCAPKNLWMTRTPLGSDDNIYTWLSKQVLPDVIVNEERKDKPRLAILNTGAIRFDIFKGAFTRDTTYIVSPFKSGMNYLPDVPYRVASKVLALLNQGDRILSQGVDGLDMASLGSRFMGIPEQMSIKQDIIHHHHPESATGPTFNMQDGEGRGESIQKALGGNYGDGDGKNDEPSLIGGYTTIDDVSAEGDDTVHIPLNFYAMPNCIQAEINLSMGQEEDEKKVKGTTPELVDLVFMDFIEPWVLLAVESAGGGKVDKDEVKRYQEGTFADAMVEWIRKNWGGSECLKEE